MMDNQFDFTIAIAPTGANLDREMLYIKSALLYADSVTLISPVAELYVDYTSDEYKKDTKSKFRLVNRIMAMIKTTHPDVYNENIGIIQQGQQFFTSKKTTSVPYHFKATMNAGLNEMIKTIGGVLPEVIGEDNCAALNLLIQNKKLKLVRFKNPFSDSDEYIWEFFEHLHEAIPNSFPLYDEQSSDLLKSALDSKILSLSDADRTKVTHAGLADNYMQRLPSFEEASVDEILDIRNDLDKPLVRFRGQMLKYTDTIESMPWDKDFETECQLLYSKEVAPALLEIEESVMDNNILKNLGHKVLGETSIWKGLGGLAVGVAASGALATYSQVMSVDKAALVAGGAWLASKIAESYKDYSSKKHDIEKNNLYFYYKAGEILKS